MVDLLSNVCMGSWNQGGVGFSFQGGLECLGPTKSRDFRLGGFLE